jgi:predicted AAA+ superfamily ATPase
LSAHLTGFTSAAAGTVGGREYFGALAEQCVALELRKQSAWTQQPFQLYHYRDLDGLEVDIVAELPDGQLLAIEVKSTRTVTEQSWSALERFRNRYPDRKTTGVVLHGGTQVAHLHGWLHVLPMRSLWDH